MNESRKDEQEELPASCGAFRVIVIGISSTRHTRRCIVAKVGAYGTPSVGGEFRGHCAHGPRVA